MVTPNCENLRKPIVLTEEMKLKLFRNIMLAVRDADN